MSQPALTRKSSNMVGIDGQAHLRVLATETRKAEAELGIIGQSKEMTSLFDLIDCVADTDSTLLIQGETGTGKGLIAKSIHLKSSRSRKPFIAINCGAIPKNLLESELFGHVRGAFTGATCSKSGKFERADGGTIFLDEIGDMSPDLQVKILKVLEEREFEPVGGAKTISVDVRVIAATHRDLFQEVHNGNFRADLFYRLNVIPMQLPPLKDRSSDIPLLTNHFLQQFNGLANRQIEGLSDKAQAVLMNHDWPGNVRELKNMIERLVVLKGQGVIDVQDLPPNFNPSQQMARQPAVEISDDGFSLNAAVTDFEKALILKSLEQTDWVKNKAAKLLHLNRTTLVEKIKRHKLQKCA